MIKEPLVSIVVPLYNYKRFIGDCIRSIRNQDYDNYELIVVDDHSTDGSYKKAKKFENKKIKVIQLNKNCGYSKAKNEGIILSNGEIITTLDADDMMTKKSISARVKAIVKRNVQFVFAHAYAVIGDIRLEDCYKGKHFKNHCSLGIYDIHAQTIMLKKDIFRKYGLFDENLRSRSDREMWWRLFGKSSKEKSNVSSFLLDKYVAYYRIHSQSMWRVRKRNKKLDEEVKRKSEKAYNIRKKEGITKKNTRFL